MTLQLVYSIEPTGSGRSIKLAGMDLWIMASIDNVFVYPCGFDFDRFEKALAQTLSLWPIVAGRLRLEDNDQYVIEMSDNGVPIWFVDNTELPNWPLNSNVVIDLGYNMLSPYIEVVKCENLLRGSETEPLLHLKLTRLVKSDEWIMGISWSHVLGDADACFRFLKVLSRFYQEMKPLELLPIFERRLWQQNEADMSLLPLMRHLRDARPTEETLKHFTADQTTHKQVNLYFSGEQLRKLRTLAGNSAITIQDALTAYIIVTLNNYCFLTDDKKIQRSNTVVNFRGISDSIACQNVVANCTFTIQSDLFDDPHSLVSIARTIRQSIIRCRDQNFLKPCLATVDVLMTRMAKENRLADMRHPPNEIIVNSNLRYDWAGLVDFGHTNKCRFHTAWTGALYLRVFRLNPVFDGTKWISRDLDGAEVAFRIENNLKEPFIDAWQEDVRTNFVNVKQ